MKPKTKCAYNFYKGNAFIEIVEFICVAGQFMPYLLKRNHLTMTGSSRLEK